MEKFVTREDCVETSKTIIKEIKQINGTLKKIEESTYGIERAGKVEGGLVNMVNDLNGKVESMGKDVAYIRKNGHRTKLGVKEKVAIAAAFISSIGSWVATYLGAILN